MLTDYANRVEGEKMDIINKSDRYSPLKDFCDLMVKQRTPGCVLVVYRKGEKAFEYAAGVSSIETGKPMQGNEYFNIYSCSKIMTVTAAAQLLENGSYLLGDPLGEYIPEFRNMKVRTKDGIIDAQNKITIGDLFSMTAGLDYNLNSESIKRARELTNGAMDTAEVVRCIASEPLSFEPGTHWQYSLCHDVLAGLVSIITGMKFRDYVKENILDPLDMRDTVYHATPDIEAIMAEQYTFVPNNGSEVTDIVEAQKKGTSGGYTSDGSFKNVGKRVSHILGPEYDSGGAGITTTTPDYAKLIAALSRGGLGLTGERILSPATVELMKVNRLDSEQLRDFNWSALRGYGYGLGVRTHIDQAKSGSIAYLGEFGWGGAAGATVICDTKAELGLFFAQHTLNPREEWYQPRLRNVAYSCID